MRTVPLIKHVDRPVHVFPTPPALHPTGAYHATITEWGEIKQARSGFMHYCGARVTTDKGTTWCTQSGSPHTLMLLRSFMPVGSSHAIEVEHKWLDGHRYASATFAWDPGRGGL